MRGRGHVKGDRIFLWAVQGDGANMDMNPPAALSHIYLLLLHAEGTVWRWNSSTPAAA